MGHFCAERKFLYILLNSEHVVEKGYHLLHKTEIPWKKLIPDSTNLVLFYFIMESFFSRVFLLHNGIIFFQGIFTS